MQNLVCVNTKMDSDNVCPDFIHFMHYMRGLYLCGGEDSVQTLPKRRGIGYVKYNIAKKKATPTIPEFPEV